MKRSALVIALLLTTCGPQSASGRGARCGLEGSQTVKRSNNVVVYRAVDGQRDYRACWVPTGLTTRLSKQPGRIHVDAIAGRMLAFRFTDPDFSGKFTFAIALDVQSGRRVSRSSVLMFQHDEAKAPIVSPLRVLTNGTLAWAARDADDATNTWEVNVAYPHSYEVDVLDSSPLVAPGSVALIPGFVYWTNDGRALARSLCSQCAP